MAELFIFFNKNYLKHTFLNLIIINSKFLSEWNIWKKKRVFKRRFEILKPWPKYYEKVFILSLWFYLLILDSTKLDSTENQVRLERWKFLVNDLDRRVNDLKTMEKELDSDVQKHTERKAKLEELTKYYKGKKLNETMKNLDLVKTSQEIQGILKNCTRCLTENL